MRQLTKLLPSAHIAEIFFPLMDDEKKVLDIVKKISDIDFYQGFELGMISNSNIARQIESIAQQKQLMVTQWMTFELLKNNLNLASIDPVLRKKSVEHAKQLVHLAAECGTTKLSMVSGNAPEKHQIEEAKRCLADSIIAIGEEVNKQYPTMSLQLEPLDCFAHKKQLIGLTNDTVVWMQGIRPEFANFYLAWDSAHVALNEEDFEQSLQTAAPFISQIHLANAVLDPAHSLYGDYHMPIGEPGFLNNASAVAIIKTAQSLSIDNRWRGLPIAIEMRSKDSDDCWENEGFCRRFLQTALENAQN